MQVSRFLSRLLKFRNSNSSLKYTTEHEVYNTKVYNYNVCQYMYKCVNWNPYAKFPTEATWCPLTSVILGHGLKLEIWACDDL